MPPQKKPSSLAKKLGEKGRRAHDAAKDKPVSYGRVELPPGIVGGVARLADAKWDEYKTGDKTGKPYVMFRGVVLSPLKHGNVRTEGQQFNVMIPLCDEPTKKNAEGGPRTFEDNYDTLLNHFRMLGVDTEGTTIDDLDAILETLRPNPEEGREGVTYLFSTRSWTPPKTAANPDPTPMVFTQIDGLAEDYDGEPDAETQDDTATAGEDEAEEEAAFDDGATIHEEDEDTAAVLKALAKKADKGDKAAAKTLTAAAKEAGIKQKTIDDSDSWADIVALIVGGDEDEEAEEEEEETEEAEEPAEEPEEEESDDFIPHVEDVFGYRPVDKVTKKPSKKAVEVEVDKVYPKTKTADVHVLGDAKKTFAGVPWASLEAIET